MSARARVPSEKRPDTLFWTNANGAQAPSSHPQAPGSLSRSLRHGFPTAKSAAKKAKIARSSHIRWLVNDPKYASAFAALKDDVVKKLEAEVYRRAVTSIERPITVAGERVMVREYSDRLLMFLLKAEKPNKYRDRREVKYSGDVNE